VDWFSGIEVSSVEMVQTYVANGYGIGVTVAVPGTKYHPQVRALALDGFEQPVFGILWQGGHNPLLDTFCKIVQAAARKLMDGQDPRLMLMK
jgi:DNA-binding transcriptional LysR family regulator